MTFDGFGVARLKIPGRMTLVTLTVGLPLTLRER